MHNITFKSYDCNVLLSWAALVNSWDDGNCQYNDWTLPVTDRCDHVARWTYEQAVNLFMENTALAEAEIRCEIRRYITWPAQVWTPARETESLVTELPVVTFTGSVSVFNSHECCSGLIINRGLHRMRLWKFDRTRGIPTDMEANVAEFLWRWKQMLLDSQTVLDSYGSVAVFDFYGSSAYTVHFCLGCILNYHGSAN